MDRRQFLTTGSTAALALFANPALAFAPAGPGDAALAALLQRQFEQLLLRAPELATQLGLDKGPGAPLKSRLSDASKAGIAAQLAETKAARAALSRTDVKSLSEVGRLNLEVVDYLLDQQITAGDRFDYGSGGGSPYVISQLSGSYASTPDFLDSQHVIATAADAEAYLARLTAFATVLDQETESQRADAAKGVFAPDFALDLAASQLQALRVKPAAETVLVTSIVRRTKEKNLPGDWGARATAIVDGKVFPALDRQIALVKELRAKATHDAGVWRLPKGDELYALSLRQSTTTDLTPAEVHQMGLDQVAQITAQIDAILKAQGMTQGSVVDRLNALNKDPKQLYANTDAGRAELLSSLNDQVKAMEAKLPQAFATLPKAKLEIRRVPEFIQDGAPNGYYNLAAIDGSRPAIYYINLKDTSDWPKYQLPTLSFHEGVPGHHLQLSLAQEAEGVPMLRKLSPFGAYVEGWALYAEQLADELGFYDGDPLGKAGFLQSYLFRAARLVVDTGIHYKKWSREKAIAYMVETTGFPEPKMTREVERYCVWPGQACSYKVGHLAWARVRDKVKAIQGAKFDLRQFHQILLEGGLPLTLLEREALKRARTAA